MTVDVAFVLHSQSDIGLASELAAGLSPHCAVPLPLRLEARVTEYGAGAICVLLWTPHAAEVDRVALPCLDEHLIVCRVGEAPLLPEMEACQLLEVASAAALGEMIAQLRAVISTRQVERVVRRDRMRGGVSPALGTSAGNGRQRGQLFMRSAWGVAATVAVVGVIAPAIGQRAAAVALGDEGANPGAPPSAMSALAASRIGAVQPEDRPVEATGRAVEVAHVSYPSQDTLMALIAPNEPSFALPSRGRPFLATAVQSMDLLEDQPFALLTPLEVGGSHDQGAAGGPTHTLVVGGSLNVKGEPAAAGTDATAGDKQAAASA